MRLALSRNSRLRDKDGLGCLSASVIRVICVQDKEDIETTYISVKRATHFSVEKAIITGPKSSEFHSMFLAQVRKEKKFPQGSLV